MLSLDKIYQSKSNLDSIATNLFKSELIAKNSLLFSFKPVSAAILTDVDTNKKYFQINIQKNYYVSNKLEPTEVISVSVNIDNPKEVHVFVLPILFTGYVIPSRMQRVMKEILTNNEYTLDFILLEQLEGQSITSVLDYANPDVITQFYSQQIINFSEIVAEAFWLTYDDIQNISLDDSESEKVYSFSDKELNLQYNPFLKAILNSQVDTTINPEYILDLTTTYWRSFDGTYVGELLFDRYESVVIPIRFSTTDGEFSNLSGLIFENNQDFLKVLEKAPEIFNLKETDFETIVLQAINILNYFTNELLDTYNSVESKVLTFKTDYLDYIGLLTQNGCSHLIPELVSEKSVKDTVNVYITEHKGVIKGFNLSLGLVSSLGYWTTDKDFFERDVYQKEIDLKPIFYAIQKEGVYDIYSSNLRINIVRKTLDLSYLNQFERYIQIIYPFAIEDKTFTPDTYDLFSLFIENIDLNEYLSKNLSPKYVEAKEYDRISLKYDYLIIPDDIKREDIGDNKSRFKLTPVWFIPKKNNQKLLEQLFYNPPTFETVKTYYDIYKGNILPLAFFGKDGAKFYIPVLSTDSFQKLIDMSGIDFVFDFDSSKLLNGYDFIAEINKLLDLPIPEVELFKSWFKTLTQTLASYDSAAVILGIYDTVEDEIVGLIRLPFSIQKYSFINPIVDTYKVNKLWNLFTYEKNPTPDDVPFSFKLGAILQNQSDFFKIRRVIVNRVAEIHGSIKEISISGYTVSGDYTTITFTADDLTNSYDESLRAYVLDIDSYDFINYVEVSGIYSKRPISFEYYDRIEFNIDSQIPEVDANTFAILTFKNTYIPYQVFQSLADLDKSTSANTETTQDSLNVDVDVVKNKLFLEYTVSVNPHEDQLIAGKVSVFTVYPEIFYFKHLLDKLPDSKLCAVLNGFITNDTTAYVDYTSLSSNDQTILENISDTIAFINFADVVNGKVSVDSDVDYILPVFDQSSAYYGKPFKLIVRLVDDFDYSELFDSLRLTNRFDPGKADVENGTLAVLAEGIVKDFKANDTTGVDFVYLPKVYKLALIAAVKSEIPKSIFQPIHLVLESYVDGTLVATKDIFASFYILSRADLFSSEVSFRPQILRFLDIQDNETGIYFVDIVEKLNNPTDTTIAKIGQIWYDIVVATEDIEVGIPTDLTTYTKVDDLVNALTDINNLQFISLTDRDNQRELQRLINFLHDLLSREYPDIPEFKYTLTVKINPKYYGLNDAAFSLNSYVYNIRNFVRIPYIVYDREIETIQLLNVYTNVKYGRVSEVMPDVYEQLYDLLDRYSESNIYEMLSDLRVPYKSEAMITILNSSKHPNYLIFRLAYNDSGLNDDRIDNTEVIFEVSPFEYGTYYLWQEYDFSDITSSEGGFLVYDIIYKDSITGSEQILGQVKLAVPQFDFYANYLFNILNRVNLSEEGVVKYEAITNNYKNFTLEQKPVRKTYLTVDYQIDSPKEIYLKPNGVSVLPVKIFGNIVLNDQTIKEIINTYGSLDYLRNKYLHIPFSLTKIPAPDKNQIDVELPKDFRTLPIKLYPLAPNKLYFEGEIDIPLTTSYSDVYYDGEEIVIMNMPNFQAFIMAAFRTLDLADSSSLEALKQLIKDYPNYDLTIAHNFGLGPSVSVNVILQNMLDEVYNITTYEPKTMEVKYSFEYENYPAFVKNLPDIPCDCYLKFWKDLLDVEPYSDLTISATFASQLPEYDVPFNFQINGNSYPNPTLGNVPENILQIKSIQNPNLQLTDLLQSQLNLKALDNRIDVYLKLYGDINYYKFQFGINDKAISVAAEDVCKTIALQCRKSLIEGGDIAKFDIVGLNVENISEKERRFETEVNQHTVLIMNPNRTILGVIPISVWKEVDGEITLSHFSVLTDYPDEIFIIANWYFDNVLRIDKLNQNMSPEYIADFAFRNPPAYQTFGKNQLAINSGFTILKEFKGSGIIGFILLSSKLQYSGSYNLAVELEYSFNGTLKQVMKTFNIQVIPPAVLDNNKLTAVLRRIDVPTYFNFRRMQAGVEDWFKLYITGKLSSPDITEAKGLKGAKGLHGLY